MITTEVRTALDVARARRETRGCRDDYITFNAAGASLMPQHVADAVRHHLDLEERWSGYPAMRMEAQKKLLDDADHAAAELLGGHPDEIAVVGDATEAWQHFFYALKENGYFRPGDRILTCKAEYASNLLAIDQVCEKTGATYEFIPNDQSGQLDVSALANMLDKSVRLITFNHVPTNGGLVQPAKAVGKLAEEANVLFLLDACQSVGQMPINVQEIGCDALSFTGRKYVRAHTLGVLWARKDLILQLEPQRIDLHGATYHSRFHRVMRQSAERFERWEGYRSGKIALGIAMRYAMSWGLENISERITGLADSFRKKLGSIRGVAVHDLGLQKCGIVTFTVEGKSAEEVRKHLEQRNVNVNISRKPSTPIEMHERGLDELVRASVHYYNTEEEVDRVCDVIEIFTKC